MILRIIQYLAIVGVTALLGFSIAKVDGQAPWPYLLGGAAVSTLALILASIFKPKAAAADGRLSRHQRQGFGIALGGFMLALCGWLLAVFVSHSAGFYVALAGILTGLLGIAILLRTMIGRQR